MKIASIVAAAFFLLLSRNGFGQNNAPSSFDKVVQVSTASQSDTSDVIVNYPKRISDYYSTPVPAQAKNDTIAPIVNPARREDEVHPH